MTAMEADAGAVEVLRVSDDQRVRLVTFDRPDVLNAFDRALYTAAAEALENHGCSLGAGMLCDVGQRFLSHPVQAQCDVVRDRRRHISFTVTDPDLLQREYLPAVGSKRLRQPKMHQNRWVQSVRQPPNVFRHLLRQ